MKKKEVYLIIIAYRMYAQYKLNYDEVIIPHKFTWI